MGRPRLVGTRLSSLQQVLANRRTRWQRLIVADWYGQGQRLVELTSGTAIWYHTGLPPVPIRWVLVRDPECKFETRALLCTQLDQDPRQIVQWFLWRWQVGVSSQGHIVQSVRDRPGPKDSGPVAWEAPWRESKTA